VARRAPAVDRSVAVLNLLASKPGERLTLSEIGREADVNKATLHAILAALTEAGYLVRDEARKTYGLGPAVIALGTAALAAYPAVDVAMPEMHALSEELGLDCVASAAIADEIVILARAGTPRPFGIYVQPGQRLPLAPPMGTVFVAWASEAEVERWLARVGPGASARKRSLYHRALGVVRERGYSVGLGDVADDEYALIELEPSASYRPNHIGAPVFDAKGDVALGLFLIGFRDQIPADKVPAFADRLLSATTRVTQALGGRGQTIA
jgi:DNA-binding IclR family transcriptional regulator